MDGDSTTLEEEDEVLSPMENFAMVATGASRSPCNGLTALRYLPLRLPEAEKLQVSTTLRPQVQYCLLYEKLTSVDLYCVWCLKIFPTLFPSSTETTASMYVIFVPKMALTVSYTHLTLPTILLV